MNTQQINFKWVVKHVPIYLQIVFLVLSAISAFEGVLNAVLFGQLTNINFSNIDHVYKFIGLAPGAYLIVYIAMLLFYFFKGAMGISRFGFFLWGLSFGPLVTLFQAAVGNQVESGKDVAMSVQSCMFNLSIMITTWIAGLLLISCGPTSLIWYAVLLAIPGMIISIFAKHTLRRIG